MDGEDGGGGAECPHIIEVDKPGGPRRPRRCSPLRHVSVEAVVGDGQGSPPPAGDKEVRVGVRGPSGDSNQTRNGARRLND